MSGLHFLNSDDFYINETEKGQIMCTGINGFCLLLFYSTQCPHCQNLIPIFKKLPGTIGGISFGMINVDQNKKIVMMSRKTLAPIKVVPTLLLYINNKPYMEYSGPHNLESITSFIMEVSKTFTQSANKTQNQQRQHQQQQQQNTMTMTRDEPINPSITNSLKQQQLQHQQPPKENEQIPAYTIGRPLYGCHDESYGQSDCLMSFDEAYKGM